MKSLTELYRIGLGPSSSHTMGPRFAAQAFRATLPSAAARVRVTLCGSLAMLPEERRPALLSAAQQAVAAAAP